MGEYMINKYNIIDAHMHIGKTYRGMREAKLDEYLDNAEKMGIQEAVVIPPCIPDFIDLPSGDRCIPFLYKDGHSMCVYDGKYGLRYEAIKSDPFTLVNRRLFDEVRKKRSPIKLHFAPLMHPLFGEFSTFSTDEWKDIIAIKIHPSFFKIGECTIRNGFFEMVERMKKPLIIHTGFKNSLGRDWLNLLADYDINVLFAHACRLDPLCVDIINSDKRYYVGIAPYKQLNSMKQFSKSESFIQGVFNMFDIEKIVFDTDYAENVDENGVLYWENNDIDKLNLSNEDKQKLFSLNAKRLYGI